MDSNDFSTAAKLGSVLSLLGVLVALALDTVSEATQVAATIGMMSIAFVASLAITGARLRASSTS